MTSLRKLVRREVDWQASGDAERPYRATVEGAEWVVRINDFPAEPMYTLFVGGNEIGDLDDWPDGWKRPG